MNMKGNTNVLILISIFISFVLHFLFFGVSRHIWLSANSADLFDQTQKLFNIQSVHHEMPNLSTRDLVETYVKKIKFQDPADQIRKIDRMFKPSDTIQMPESPVVLPEEQSLIQDADLGRELGNQVKEEIAVRKRKVDKDTLREMDLEKWISDAKKIAEGDIVIPGDFVEQMPGFTPDRVSETRRGRGLVPERTEQKAASAGNSRDYDSLDEFLSVELSVYKDPQENKGYYQMAIFPASQPADLEVLPKEVIFLVDTSLSIKAKRLREFKSGIKYSLQNLNPGDTFNIFSFKEDISYFSVKAEKATDANVERAMKFLRGIRASQRTDLYQAFLESIRYQASQYPSYLILLSDGRPNTGVTSPVQIVSEISDINAKKRAVFTFSGGKKVNRFLVDFLAYENRGWSEFAKEDNFISEKFKEFYNKIRNPILTDVEFQVSQIDSTEIFPKHLPDIYRDTAFLIYGRFDDENEFSVRVSGQSHGQKKELIFTRNLGWASTGGEEIAKAWALNKIYYLTSELTRKGYKVEAVKEIRRLSKKFKIRTPYDLYF